MEEWKEYKLKEICLKITDGSHSSPEAIPLGYPMFSVKDMLENRFDYTRCKHISKDDFLKLKKGDCVPQKGDVLVAKDGSFLKQIFVCKETKEECILSSIAIFRPNKDIIYPEFLSYLLKSPKVYNYIASNCVSGSALPRIILKDFKEINVTIPNISVQKKVLDILLPLDDKIELNRRVNENLEQQAQVLFNNMFGSQIDNLTETPYCLGDLINCIDNRGKTPMLSPKKTEFPIIDVKALSGKSRIINYENCTKYVSEETYNTWFRSGHPIPWDILMSTVGSLAELKIFLGTKGCIAQNVIGLRAKNISALYLYQYLLYVKEKLLTYNIGSVQPSIKVTHIIKYPIFVPSKDELRKFDEVAKHITNQIYTLNEQIIYLSNLRDTLLPKLMSGELKLSEIETELDE